MSRLRYTDNMSDDHTLAPMVDPSQGHPCGGEVKAEVTLDSLIETLAIEDVLHREGIHPAYEYSYAMAYNYPFDQETGWEGDPGRCHTKPGLRKRVREVTLAELRNFAHALGIHPHYEYRQVTVDFDSSLTPPCFFSNQPIDLFDLPMNFIVKQAVKEQADEDGEWALNTHSLPSFATPNYRGWSMQLPAMVMQLSLMRRKPQDA